MLVYSRGRPLDNLFPPSTIIYRSLRFQFSVVPSSMSSCSLSLRNQLPKCVCQLASSAPLCSINLALTWKEKRPAFGMLIYYHKRCVDAMFVLRKRPKVHSNVLPGSAWNVKQIQGSSGSQSFLDWFSYTSNSCQYIAPYSHSQNKYREKNNGVGVSNISRDRDHSIT
jgi:hypothetical protein